MLTVWIVSAALCAAAMHAAYAQEATVDGGPAYEIHIPDMMIRGQDYRGVVISDTPVYTDTTFRFGAGSGDILLPGHTTMKAGSNHALFDVRPVDHPALSGRVSTHATAILPDGTIRQIRLETHPGAGAVSRLWMVGPGANGVMCDGPEDTSAAAIADRATGGVFDGPDPGREIRTRLPQTAIHVFLADRYCTPVAAPPGGVAFTVSSDAPGITFGGGRTHLTGVIPYGYNSAILDVTVNGAGIIYATGNGVSPDSMRVEGVSAEAGVRLGIGPSQAMESSYVMWYVWLERDGRQYVPDGPLPVYLTTDNPVLAGFDRTLVDSAGPAFADIRPHRAIMLEGSASGVIHTGTPAVVGDLRLLAGDRDITVWAHIPGYGSASASFRVGVPGAVAGEFRLQTDRLRECMAEESALPDGFYSATCTEMWHRLLVASHFFDVRDSAGEPLDSEADTIEFLDGLFGGDNTDSGTALYDMVNRLNEFSVSDDATGGLAGDLTGLLAEYLRTSDISLEPVQDLGLTAGMLGRMPDDPPPNQITLEAFPGRPGMSHVVLSAMYVDDSFRFPVYLPDGTVTLAGDRGLAHEPEVRMHGSAPRPEAPGTRPSAVSIPVQVLDGGTLTASLGGVGSSAVSIPDMAPASGKRLHVSTLPASGERDLMALVSVLDADGLLTTHDGEIHVEAGRGAHDVELEGWRGGGGMIRGSVDGIGEIVVHAPGLGGGTALTMPVRQEASLDVWHPDTVHVAEEFPLAAHTLDSDGMPMRLVQVEVSGDVESSGMGLELGAAGMTPIIAEHGGLFHAGVIRGFLNGADVRVEAGGRVVELNDTVVVNVYTGAMGNPRVTVHGGALLFSGDHTRWEAVADTAGPHAIQVSVHEPGWEPYTEVLDVRVSNLLDLEYDAVTISGVRADADLAVCGHVMPGGSVHRMEPALCEVSVPYDIRVGGISHTLESLAINGVNMQPGATHNFAEDAEILATYGGVIVVEARALLPDGTSEELLWGRHAPGDIITVAAEPRYGFWGLVWDRPVHWSGLPRSAVLHGDVAEWEATADADITIGYERDLTYVVMLGAAALGAPVAFMMRRRLPGVRFK